MAQKHISVLQSETQKIDAIENNFNELYQGGGGGGGSTGDVYMKLFELLGDESEEVITKLDSIIGGNE